MRYTNGVTVAQAEPEFLSVRESARRLGVHENTIRNWIKTGVLTTARVPGSKFHRLDERDVERVRRQRGATVSSVESERRTIGPELVDGTQLSHWATTRDAQEKLPELVRRLLAATSGITNVSVRSGEGISAPGWDGTAESGGTAHLPGGPLYFEFGAGGQPKSKADADYNKRCQDPAGAQPANSTFVFVTPRRWAGAAAWVADRKADGVWADVKVVDADDLEGWLQATPAVHYWISEHLGRRPRHAETLERWWDRFQQRTNPPLPAELFLAGRHKQRELLKAFVGGVAGVVAVQADWRDEAVAFISATVQAMQVDMEQSPQPTLVIASAEVWDRVATQSGRLTLIPLFNNPDLAAAEASGHHVIIPVGRDEVARGEKIVLPRPHRQVADEALRAVGIRPDRAYRLAALSRRSMPALIRELARDRRVSRPPWAQLPDAAILAPLVLAGAWTSSEADIAAISQLAGESWPNVERLLLERRSSPDPAFVRTGGQWYVASAVEAFLLLHHALTDADLGRWRDSTIEILLELDPTLDLTPDERPMAGVMGVSRKFSSTLRRGVAEGIALLGSLDSDQLDDGVRFADHARAVVRALLARANEDETGAIWRSLSDVLPLLAEAAPEVFLDAVHDDLDGTRPKLASMFQDGDQSSWLHSSSPHTGLLWALETLCWSPDHLLEASRALARLDVVDPGGRLANRPMESLGSILVIWIHHTAAPPEIRRRAVEQICQQSPEVGWRLLLSLWPSHHATSSPPHSPRFRDWKPASEGVPIPEWIETVRHLVEMAERMAADDASRWSTLATRLAPLPPSDRTRLLDALAGLVDSAVLQPDARLALWDAIHQEIARHRKFADAEWSMDDETLAKMQEIADALEPTEDTSRLAYLFDWHPDLPDVDFHDHAAYDGRLLELRIAAIRQAFEAGGIDGLADLAERSAAPGQLGWAAAALDDLDLSAPLLPWLTSENPKRVEVAQNWAGRTLNDGDVASLWDLLARPEVDGPEARLAVALCAPATSETWDLLVETDNEMLDAYWSRIGPWHIRGSDTERAARQLIAHGQAWAAVDLLAAARHGGKDGTLELPTELVVETLDAALSSDPRGSTSQSAGYEVGLLLDHLQDLGVGADVLARYEFAFFRLLDDYRQPRALYQAMGADPALFVDLVGRVYRGKDEPRRQLDENDEAMAHHAWWVLNHWNGVPGQREDGTLDADHLRAWVHEARLALAEADRSDIGDEQIGRVLSSSPSGADGVWPSEPVREILESLVSRSLETGMHVGVINGRGGTSRGVFDGGEQERRLAARYRDWAAATAGSWPRTTRLLRGLAEDYERDARREDIWASTRADTE